MVLNTLRLYEKFKTRFDEETSHLLVESLEEVASQLQIPPVELLATKEDLRELRQELKDEMERRQTSLIKWMVGLLAAHLAIVLAMLGTFMAFLS